MVALWRWWRSFFFWRYQKHQDPPQQKPEHAPPGNGSEQPGQGVPLADKKPFSFVADRNISTSLTIIPECWYAYQSSGITNLARTRQSVRMAREHQSLQARFGQRVKRLREARGWSFTYLSVHSGLAKNTIVEVESGRTEPRLNTIAALAGSFGKTLSELLRGL